MSTFGPPIDDMADGVRTGYISNVMEDRAGSGPLPFHADYSFTPLPVQGIVLYAVELPPQGTSTCYANGALAAATLPDDLRREVEDLTATHTLGLFAPGTEGLRSRDHQLPPEAHPPPPPGAARHIRVPARPSCSSPTCTSSTSTASTPRRATGSSTPCCEHLYQPAHVYEHRWIVDDLVVWDNETLQHMRTDISNERPRELSAQHPARRTVERARYRCRDARPRDPWRHRRRRLGRLPPLADVAIDGGTVTAVGEVEDAGREELDVDGCMVTPGFVDPHTHLDAAAVLGPGRNADVPARSHHRGARHLWLRHRPVPARRRRLPPQEPRSGRGDPVRGSSLGVPFTWESWPEFLDYLGSQALGVNVAGMVPHSALRYAVMGERAREGAATDDELAGVGDRAPAVARGRRARICHLSRPQPPRTRPAIPSRVGTPTTPSSRPSWPSVGVGHGRSTSRRSSATTRPRSPPRSSGTRPGPRPPACDSTWTPLFADPGTDVWRDVLAHNHLLNERVEVAPPR